MSSRETRQAPRPRNPHEAMNRPVEKSKDFSGSLKRLIRELRPDYWFVSIALIAAVFSVAFNVAAPKVLGKGTDIIFNGVISKMIAQAPSKEAAVAALEAQGKTDLARMLDSMDITPGAGIDFDALGRVLLITVGIYLAAALISFLSGWVLRIAVQNLGWRLRDKVQRKIEKLPLSYFDSHSRGDLMSRVSNDVDNIAQVMNQTLSQLFQAVLMVLGILAMMLTLSWKLTLLALIVIPLGGALTGVLMSKAQPQFRQQWKSTGEVSDLVEETISGHEVLALYGLEERYTTAFEKSNTALYRSSFIAQFISNLVMPLMNMISNISYVIVAVGGGLMVAKGSMSLGDVQAFIQYSRQLNQPIGQLAQMMNSLQSGVASAERVFEFLDAQEMAPDRGAKSLAEARKATGAVAVAAELTESAGRADGVNNAESAESAELTQGTLRAEGESLAKGRALHAGSILDEGDSGAGEEEHVSGRVVFDHVRFSYVEGTPIIQDLSLEVDPGQMVAIIGPTGAGKTTLVNLLMRFYELDSGRITLDGVDISTLDKDVLRAHMGMVLQDTWLFEGTIEENIAFGSDDASSEEVVDAAKQTAADRLIRHLPEGYETHVSDSADVISQGERQLLTIARAFVSRPDILILDEATSSVDTRTEVLVQKAMDRLRRGRTAFVIAHRLSTIRDADVILVMEQGDVVEMGRHEELLAAGGAYARLYNAQFAGPAEASTI